MGSIWDADYVNACGNSKWEVNTEICWNNSILLPYTVTSIFNALKLEVRQVCKVIFVHHCNRTLKYNFKYIVTYCSAADICICFKQLCHFLDSSGGKGGGRERERERARDVQCRKCDSKKVKVHAVNIYPCRSPEVSLREVCVPLDTLLAIAPLLFCDSCLSAVHLETAMADTEVFGRGIVKLSGLWTNRPKIHPTQNYCGFGLCPSSSILETRKHSILETGSVSVLRWGKTPTLLSPLERANPNHWTRQWAKSKNAVILSIMHHHQNPLESTYSSHCYTDWNHFQMQWKSDMRPLFWMCYMTSRQDSDL
jgi:hypothetical protein